MIKKKSTILLPELDFSKLDFTDKKLGFCAVLIGIVIALVLGMGTQPVLTAPIWIYSVMVIGVIVGILNIFHEEGVLFLISTLTITFMLSVLADSMLFPIVTVTLFNAVIYLLAPAAIIVGLKVIYALATR